MDKREYLAHRAMHAVFAWSREPRNPLKVSAMDEATSAMCPECEHAILYCRCFENTDSGVMSEPNRRRPT